MFYLQNYVINVGKKWSLQISIPQYQVLVLTLSPIYTVSFNTVFSIPQNQCYPGTPCTSIFGANDAIKFALRVWVGFGVSCRTAFFFQFQLNFSFGRTLFVYCVRKDTFSEYDKKVKEQTQFNADLEIQNSNRL